MSLTDCLTSEKLNSFLEGQLVTGEREGIELHLSRCRKCRRHLAALYSASRPERMSVRAPRWLKARALAIPGRRHAAGPVSISTFRRHAAAALAVVVVAVAVGLVVFLFQSDAERQLTPSDVLRQEQRIVTAPRLLAPSGGAVIASDEIEFHWSKVVGAAGYQFTLLNEKGDILFQSSTNEERLALKANAARLERGKPYFWYVAAKSPFGTTADSEVGRFSLSR